jgi:hypothetical protein
MKAKTLTQLLLIIASCHVCYGQFILNGDFESTPNFKNWSTDGDANIWTAGVNGFPAGDTSSTKYGELSTDDTSGAVIASVLETFLSLSSGTLGAQGGGTAGSGSAIKNVTVTVTQANLNAGNRFLSLKWDLITDINPANNPSQKDYGFLTLSGPASTFKVLGNIQSPSMHLDNPQLNNVFKYETGWQTFNGYAFTTPGTYTLGIGVDGINQAGITTGLLVDSIQLSSVPEPGAWGLAAAGALGLFCIIRRFRSGSSTAQARIGVDLFSAKTSKTTQLMGLALLMGLLSSMPAKALPKDELAKLTKSLQAVPRPELPASAAEAVKRAKPADRNEVAAIVIRSVAQRWPACLIAVMASIASAEPAAAPSAVAEAARVIPNQAIDLASVAAQVAPSFVNEIGQAVGRPVSGTALKITEAPASPGGNAAVKGAGVGGGTGSGKGHKYGSP